MMGRAPPAPSRMALVPGRNQADDPAAVAEAGSWSPGSWKMCSLLLLHSPQARPVLIKHDASQVIQAGLPAEKFDFKFDIFSLQGRRGQELGALEFRNVPGCVLYLLFPKAVAGWDAVA